MPALNFDDVRRSAKRRLPKGLFEFIDRGAEDERGLAAMRAVFDRLRFLPPVLRDVKDRSTAVEIFGETQRSPLIVGPTGMAGLMCYKGELALARACATAGIPFCVSTDSITPIEEIAGGTNASLWFQLYFHRDRSTADYLVERAAKAGAKVLVVTVDTPIPANREYNIRNGVIPLRPNVGTCFDMLLHPGWVFGVLGRYLATQGMPTYSHFPPHYRSPVSHSERLEPTRLPADLVWDDIAAMRRKWQGRMVLKGILRKEDAQRAADLGADGIVVSNHGGRNLDDAVVAAEVLPGIVDAVGSRLTVLADGGVRRGSDAIKLLALGAKGVLVGRATLFGTAMGGEAGARRILEILATEISQTMAYLGKTDLASIGRQDLVFGSPMTAEFRDPAPRDERAVQQ